MEIVGTILDLARSLEMEVVAEGIETVEQVERRKSLGCRLGQGHYFANPNGSGHDQRHAVVGG